MLSKLSVRITCAAVTLMVVGLVLSAPLPAATAATPSAASDSSTVLSEGVGLGARPSVRVRRVQRILDRRGFNLGSPGVDGRFGPLTAAAVRRMQDKYGLTADGAVGPKTRRVLRRLASSRRTQRPVQSPSKPSKPAQPQNQSAGQAPTPASPATQPRPATPAQTAEPPADPASRMTLPVILSILAAVIATAPLAVARLRRRRPAAALEPDPVDRDALPERTSDEGDLGSDRGLALATAVPADDGEDSGRTRDRDDPPERAPLLLEGSDARRSPPGLPNGARVIGYVTASRDTAREHEAFAQIEARCERAGWELLEIIRDQDRSRMPDRPGLSRALEQIAAGDARGLVVTDTRLLIDSLGDLGALLDWFRNADAALVAVDLDLDTSTTEGHRAAGTLMRVAGWESERRAGRAWSGPVEVENGESAGGHASEQGATLFDRIDAMRVAGRSLQAIADELNREGVPPLQGRTWRPFDVESTLANARVTRRLRYALPSFTREERW
jgi:peptidoglycan hydrolase-like protein with peptidoglycan-binding domain